MTSLQQIELVCPVCDNHFRSRAVVSTNSFGGKRTDFHERAAGTQPLPYLVHMCGGCGFTGSERDFDESSNVSPWVRQQVMTMITPRLASTSELSGSEKYEYAARVAEWQGADPRQVADYLLRAAWCCVDEDDAEAERYFRRLAARKFEDALSSFESVATDERAVICYLIGELWRRVGDVTTAHEWFDRVPGEIIDADAQAWVSDAALQQRNEPREWFG
jgi:uncharacterized protein